MKNVVSCFAAAAALLCLPAAQAGPNGCEFLDPLDVGAVQEFGFPGVNSQPMLAVANAGARIVAVGLRGLIIYSDDGGRTWKQARAPVQTDLVAVHFATAEQGWATGHDAVILHTEDGGGTWTKQFDNRLAAVALPAHYQQRVTLGDTSVMPFLKQVQLNTQGDASLPFLGVYFTDPLHGIAVGSFGMIVATEDGGKHWLPCLDRIDNSEFLNLNAIRKIGDDLVIAGEQGSVYRYAKKTNSFLALPTPYKGSFFDIVGTRDFMLAVGLRGTAYRSTNGGATWQRVDTSTRDTVTAAALTPGGETLVLATSSGALLLSHDQGRTFNNVTVQDPMTLTALRMLESDHVVVLVGLKGIKVQRVSCERCEATSESLALSRSRN